MRVLLTAFEPFGGDAVNPSQRVVEAVGARGVAGVALATAVLPVDHERGPAALLAAMDDAQPDAVLCLGLATRRAAVSIERVAINLQDYPVDDNAGRRLADQPIAADGPAAYFATLPVRAMLAAMHAAGVPAYLSLTAGSFLCNQVAYVALHHAAQNNLPLRAGFVHLPALPEQALHAPDLPTMSLETMCRAIVAALEAIAEG